MKRIILSTTLALAMGNIISAQTIAGHFEFGYDDRMSFSAPKEFSYNGVPRLILSSGDKSDCSFLIYNENIEEEKNIKLNPSTFNYQLTYKVEEREAKRVEATEKMRFKGCGSLDDFIRSFADSNPTFKEDDLKYTTLENGDRRIDYDYSKCNLTPPFGNSWFFGEEYFGRKYPRFYFIEHDGYVTMYYVRYTVTYTDWVDKGEAIESKSFTIYPLRLINVNLNNDANRASEYFYVSQTLFNGDAAYEYLIPKYKMSEKGFPGQELIEDVNSGEETIEMTRKTVLTEKSNLALAGFQVVGENGKVLQDLTFDEYLGESSLDDAVVLTIGSNTYLAFDGRDSEGNNATVFYKIDRTTSSIQKVRTVPGGMNLSSTIANKGADIQVNFSDNNEKGSEISVFSANGAKVKSVKVPAGQKTATLNVNGSAGMYLINRAQYGKANETKKIVIK